MGKWNTQQAPTCKWVLLWENVPESHKGSLALYFLSGFWGYCLVLPYSPFHITLLFLLPQDILVPHWAPLFAMTPHGRHKQHDCDIVQGTLALPLQSVTIHRCRNAKSVSMCEGSYQSVRKGNCCRRNHERRKEGGRKRSTERSNRKKKLVGERKRNRWGGEAHS